MWIDIVGVSEAPKRRDPSSRAAEMTKVNFTNVVKHELGIRAWLVFGQRCSLELQLKNNKHKSKKDTG